MCKRLPEVLTPLVMVSDGMTAGITFADAFSKLADENKSEKPFSFYAVTRT
jgi:hypothetical protein